MMELMMNLLNSVLLLAGKIEEVVDGFGKVVWRFDSERNGGGVD